MSANDYSDFTPLTEDRGVLKKILINGNENLKPRKGDTVYVHYVGTFVGGEKDGQEFDSSEKRNEKFTFTLGVKDVISSWDIAVATMGIGEKCELIASPEYGYNDGETRKFLITLFDFEGEDVSLNKDKSVSKSMIKEGDTATLPLVGTSMTVSFKPAGTDVSPKVVTYTLGDPIPAQVPPGIDVALRKMHMHEVSLVKFKNDQLSGDSSPFVMYEVEVKHYEKILKLNTFDTFKEKMEFANNLKNRANDLFKDKKFTLAIEIYKRLEEEILYLVTSGTDESKELKDFKTIVLSNIAQCYLNLKDTQQCIQMCNTILGENPKHVKSIYRMGLAYQEQQDHENAVKSFKKVLDIEPDNNAAKVKLLQSSKIVIEQNKQIQSKLSKGFKLKSETGLGIPDPVIKSDPGKKISDDEEEEEHDCESECENEIKA